MFWYAAHTSRESRAVQWRSVFKQSHQLAFSVTKKDFRWDYFRAGGKGGQGQNKRSTGVRCVHPPSGAVGEGRDERSRTQNQRNAFSRCVQSDKFQAWIKKQTSKQALIEQQIETAVELAMRDENIQVEVWDGSKWVIL